MSDRARTTIGALALSAAGLIGIAMSEGWEPVARGPVPRGVPTAALAGRKRAGDRAACPGFGTGGQKRKVMGWADQQAAVVPILLRRPFQCRAGATGTQEAQPCRRAGFQRAAHATTVARRACLRLAGGRVVQVDDLLVHAGQ